MMGLFSTVPAFTWLYLTLPDCARLYLALPWSAMMSRSFAPSPPISCSKQTFNKTYVCVLNPLYTWYSPTLPRARCTIFQQPKAAKYPDWVTQF